MGCQAIAGFRGGGDTNTCLCACVCSWCSTLLGKEVLKPFFVFQLFSFILWFFFQQYYLYASLILVLSITSATYEAFLTWKHFRSIK